MTLGELAKILKDKSNNGAIRKEHADNVIVATPGVNSLLNRGDVFQTLYDRMEEWNLLFQNDHWILFR